MFHFLEGATTGAVPGSDMTMTIVMLVAMIAVFYFMLIRPENKRKKEAEQLRSNIKNGDSIITIGGITGTVVDVKEDRFVIETGADRVRLELMKWALSSNETATKNAAEQAKKAQEAKAKAKAEKQAKKNG
jgi:preprotein translocase subunit YajC